ncbi:MAG: RidA family protein [Chloroflexota bacterium]
MSDASIPGTQTGGDPEERLRQLGIELPTPARAMANYVSAVTAGDMVYVSGHGPSKDGKMAYQGKLGREYDVAAGYQAAEVVALNLLAALKAEIGSLDRVKRVVKVLGMVNSTPDFVDHPKVINGVSDLLVKVFGERGKHARSAVGMASLPAGIPVEVEMIVQID